MWPDRSVQEAKADSPLVSATAKSDARPADAADPYRNVDRIGNAIVGSSLLALGGCILAHVFGVAFIGFIAALALLVLGFLMTRGRFGDNATMGTLMMVLGPAAVLVPPFFPGLALVAPAIGAGLLVAGGLKFGRVW